jgi:hypothetical protein
MNARGRNMAFAGGLAALLFAVLAIVAGAIVLIVDQVRREDGYLTSDTITLKSGGYAVATDTIDLDGINAGWSGRSVLGDARVRVTGTRPVFIGVAPADKAAAYLSGIEHATIDDIDGSTATYRQHPGGAPDSAPADGDIWTAQTSGSGLQTLVWPVDEGKWTLVVMNADGSRGVDAAADIGATVPVLQRIDDWLIDGGVMLALAGALLVWLPRRRKTPNPVPIPPSAPRG